MCGISFPSVTLFIRASIEDWYFDGFAPNLAYASLHLRIRGSSLSDFLVNSLSRSVLAPRRRLVIVETRLILLMFFAVIAPIFRFGCSSKIFGSILNFMYIWL